MNADALSRAPAMQATENPFGIIAMLTSGDVSEEDREERDTQPLAKQQQNDPELKIMINYLKESILPDDETKAKEVVLSSTRYVLIDDIPYFSDRNDHLRIVVPNQQRKNCLKKCTADVLVAI